MRHQHADAAAKTGIQETGDDATVKEIGMSVQVWAEGVESSHLCSIRFGHGKWELCDVLWHGLWGRSPERQQSGDGGVGIPSLAHERVAMTVVRDCSVFGDDFEILVVQSGSQPGDLGEAVETCLRCAFGDSSGGRGHDEVGDHESLRIKSSVDLSISHLECKARLFSLAKCESDCHAAIAECACMVEAEVGADESCFPMPPDTCIPTALCGHPSFTYTITCIPFSMAPY